MYTINDIIRVADEKFNETEFVGRLIPERLEITSTIITVENSGVSREIPIVTEWTCAADNILVFNKIDSCLGLIAHSSDGNLLCGAHFSLPTDFFNNQTDSAKQTLGKIIGAYIVAMKTAGYVNFTSFGGSVSEWNGYSNDCLRNEEVTEITGDLNQKNWYFSIEQGQMAVNYWPSEIEGTKETEEKEGKESKKEEAKSEEE